MRQDLEVGGHRAGQPGMVIRRHPATGQRHLDELTWGLLPHDTLDRMTAPRPIYARAETVATLPFFRDAFAKRRALVPADMYIQRATRGPVEGQRHAISRIDKQPMAWAGLWEGYRDADGQIIRSYCVITVEAAGAVAEIHDRMPLMLERDDWAIWLGEQPGDLDDLLKPRHTELLQCRALARPKSPASRH